MGTPIELAEMAEEELLEVRGGLGSGRDGRRRGVRAMISSMIPKRSRSRLVILRAAAAFGACSLPFQRIVAQPSGLMTE